MWIPPLILFKTNYKTLFTKYYKKIKTQHFSKNYYHECPAAQWWPPWTFGCLIVVTMPPWTSGSLVMAAINFWRLCGGCQELSASLWWPPFNLDAPRWPPEMLVATCSGHQRPWSGHKNFWWTHIAAMKFRWPPPFSFFLLLWRNTLQFFISQKHFSKFYQTIFCLWTPLNQLSFFIFLKTQSPNIFQNFTKPTPTWLWSSWRPTWFIK